MAQQSHDSPIWTFLPGLHGTEDLFRAVRERLPQDITTEFVNLPTTGKQDYETLADWLDGDLPHTKDNRKRLLIAESFSGPLAIRLAARRPSEVMGIVLAASFCDAPMNLGVALLPLRPLFMVKPPRKALRHFLIGDDASEVEVAEIRDVIQSVPSATLSKRVATIMDLMEEDNPDLPDIPMLILQADNDNLVLWEAQSRLEADYPKATTHWIESPHLILQRRPDECIQSIVDFLDNINTGASPQ